MGTTRRATMGRGAASTLGASRGTGGNGFTGYMKDDRNLSSKAVQRDYTALIRKRLIELNFEVFKLKKAFSGPIFDPSQAEFYVIVEYLFSTSWSPDFRLDKFADKTEGIMCIARLLKYPFMLNKSSISSLTPHNMPTIIGFVGWLAELSAFDAVIGSGPDTSVFHTQRGISGANGDGDSTEINDLWQDYLTGSFRYERDPVKTAEIVRGFEDKLQQIVDSAEAEAAVLAEKSAAGKEEMQQMQQKNAELVKGREELEAMIRELDAKKDEYTKMNYDLKVLIESREAEVSQKTQEFEQKNADLSRVAARHEFLAAAVAERHITADDRRNIMLERTQATEQRAGVASALNARASKASAVSGEVRRLAESVGEKVHIYRLRRASVAAEPGKESPEDGILAGFPNTPPDVFLKNFRETVARGAEREKAALEGKNAELERAAAAGRKELAELAAEVEEERNELENLKMELAGIEERVEKEGRAMREEAQAGKDRVERLREEVNGLKEAAAKEYRDVNEDNVRAGERERGEIARIERERRELLDEVFELSKALLDHKESIIKALGVLKEDSEQLAKRFRELEKTTTVVTGGGGGKRRKSLSHPPSAKKQKFTFSPLIKRNEMK